MIGMFTAVTDFFRVRNDLPPKKTRRQRYVEQYLSESVDLVDLERRERELERKGLL